MTAPARALRPDLPAAPDYGRCFAAWRAACADQWQAYTHHPFDEGMRDGTLPRAAFLTYLVQILMSVMMATFLLMIAPRAAVCAERIGEVLDPIADRVGIIGVTLALVLSLVASVFVGAADITVWDALTGGLTEAHRVYLVEARLPRTAAAALAGASLAIAGGWAR